MAGGRRCRRPCAARRVRPDRGGGGELRDVLEHLRNGHDEGRSLAGRDLQGRFRCDLAPCRPPSRRADGQYLHPHRQHHRAALAAVR